MNCEYELSFLCDILKKCHVRTSFFSLQDAVDGLLDSWIKKIVNVKQDDSATIQSVVGDVESATKYKFTNELKLQYVFAKLPQSSDKELLFIGPYLSSPMSSREIFEISEAHGLSPNAHKFLKEYYSTLPVIFENDRFFTVVDAFLERIWSTDSFNMVEISRRHAFALSQVSTLADDKNIDETLVSMENMEMRYGFENELILAVKHGQQYKENVFLSAINEDIFEKRLQDPVRNAKNYCIIMNTLLRKAAEEGGVHPLYINRVSSDFAAKIELVTDTKAIPELMRDIFSSYCRLVRKHSTKQYSPVVKKTILVIDSDISAELSLNALAKKQGISSGYLATVFKKETQKTVSEYIRDKRINHAVRLLNTTDLQIQTIAMHCGIMDVQYFTKLFKKQVGKTPNEYRKSTRQV